jgi:hypothetical protein
VLCGFQWLIKLTRSLYRQEKVKLSRGLSAVWVSVVDEANAIPIKVRKGKVVEGIKCTVGFSS